MSEENKATDIAENKMGTMPLGKLLIQMSLPMMVSMFVQALYNIVDSIFVAKISEHAFLEWEEVYENKYYGTLRSEVERINSKGNIVVFDVDVAGGCNIKKMFGDNALSVFIMPQSVATLKERLVKRGTDAMEVIEDRVRKASYEMTFSSRFDRIVVNDDLEWTKALIRKIVKEFID